MFTLEELWRRWMITDITLFTFSTSIIFLRLYERHKRRWRPADYATLCAWIVSCAYFAATMFAGYVQSHLKYYGANYYPLTLANYPYAITNSTLVPLTKITILLIYLEIAPSKWHRRAILTTLVLVSMSMIAHVGSVIFSCQVSLTGHIWSLLYPDGINEVNDVLQFSAQKHKCLLAPVPILVQAIINVIFELVIFFLALPFVIKVKSSLSSKLGLVLAFALGWFTIAASIIGAYYVSDGLESQRKGKLDIYRLFLGPMWGLAEIYSGLAFANFLPLRGQIIRFISGQVRRFGFVHQEDSQATLTSQRSFFKRIFRKRAVEKPEKVMEEITMHQTDDFIAYKPPTAEHLASLENPAEREYLEKQKELKQIKTPVLSTTVDLAGNTWVEPINSAVDMYGHIWLEPELTEDEADSNYSSSSSVVDADSNPDV